MHFPKVIRNGGGNNSACQLQGTRTSIRDINECLQIRQWRVNGDDHLAPLPFGYIRNLGGHFGILSNYARVYIHQTRRDCMRKCVRNRLTRELRLFKKCALHFVVLSPFVCREESYV